MNVLDAAYHTVHDYPGGAEALSVRMGGKPSGQMLTNKVNLSLHPELKKHHIRLDEAVTIMGLTGDFRILKAQARQFGFLLIEMPDCDDDSEDYIVQLLLEASAKHGKVCETISDALLDGKMDKKEAQKALDRLDAQMSVEQKLRKKLVAKLKEKS